MNSQHKKNRENQKVDKKTNDDSDVHDDIIGENTEQTPLAKAVKGNEEDDKQTPSEELG